MGVVDLSEFCEQLRDLRRRAGMPTLAQLSKEMQPSAGISTLSELLAAKIRRPPRWELVSPGQQQKGDSEQDPRSSSAVLGCRPAGLID